MTRGDLARRADSPPFAAPLGQLLSLAVGLAISGIVAVPTQAQAPQILPWPVDRTASSTGGPTPFGSVPPEGVRFGSDGNVYVLDSQAATVYQFNERLQPLGTLGGRGRGPGELIQPSLLAAGSGRVAVFDPGTSRVTVYSEGAADWDAPWALVRDGIPRGMAISGDGLLIEVEPFPFVEPRERAYGRAHLLLRLDRNGEKTVVKRFPSLQRSRQNSLLDPAPAVFDPELHWIMRANGQILLSRSDRYQLDVLDLFSRETEPFASRPIDAVREVSEEIRALVRSQSLERFLANRGQAPLSRVDEQAMRQSIAEMRFSNRLPLTGEVVGGSDGIVLVQRGVGLDDPLSPSPEDALAASPTWDVFWEDGSYAGVLEFPDGFVPRDMFGDLVVGVRVGELDEVIVEVLRIRIP